MTDVPEKTTHHRQVGRALWLSVLSLVFAGWWGGLTFYAAIVVPIGTEQIGSTAQGFITQEVTHWHNTLLTTMTGALLVEAWLRRCRWLGAVTMALAVVNAALLFEHSALTDMMDFSSRTVEDTFYSQHAVYLWLTTAEWALGFALIVAAGLTGAGGSLTETTPKTLTSTDGLQSERPVIQAQELTTTEADPGFGDS